MTPHSALTPGVLSQAPTVSVVVMGASQPAAPSVDRTSPMRLLSWSTVHQSLNRASLPTTISSTRSLSAHPASALSCVCTSGFAFWQPVSLMYTPTISVSPCARAAAPKFSSVLQSVEYTRTVWMFLAAICAIWRMMVSALWQPPLPSYGESVIAHLSPVPPSDLGLLPPAGCFDGAEAFGAGLVGGFGAGLVGSARLALMEDGALVGTANGAVAGGLAAAVDQTFDS